MSMHQEPQINPSLENMMEACAAAGHPERAFSIIQITGTNGKTSTSRLCEQLCLAEGIKTGLYTSPSLVSECERIRVGGHDISQTGLDAALAAARAAAARVGLVLTAFEEMTLAMFMHFRDAGVQIAVVEVGMGGRWDATSAAAPAVAVATAVGLDHQEFLGDTHAAIAFDKAHIIKPGASVVLGQSIFAEHPPEIGQIFLDRAAEFGLHPRRVEADSYAISASSPVLTEFEVQTMHGLYKNLKVAGPEYQASNAATAIMAVEAALGRGLDSVAVKSAIAATRFPGRFEVVRKDPLLIFDGSHNPAAARILAQLIDQMSESGGFGAVGDRPVIALGVLADKDAAGIIEALAPVAADFIALTPPSPRAIPEAQLRDMILGVVGKTAQAIPDDGMPAIQSTLQRAHNGASHAREAALNAGMPSSPVAGMDALRQVLELTGKQPLVMTGSLTLYPLLQSIQCATNLRTVSSDMIQGA
ncbi:MAG: Mur ligase family protein [Coriobacteriia bacterium]|nr:Mur ligase family protein [Coriobacteriia bacterium]